LFWILEDTAVAGALYRRHSAGLAATYADIENHALNQGEVLVGTPGSVTLRENATGAMFYVRQYYDHEGRKKDQYISGSVDSPETLAQVAAWRSRIEEAKDILKTVRLLAREGYATLTPKHLATLAPLSRHGLFEAGAILVGTHAFEVIVNRLGIRAEAFATQDIDIARAAKLALENVPDGGLLELLRESGIDFVDALRLNHAEPATRFMERGRSRFTVDLLVPASGAEAEIHPVPELKTHATALPHLRYLLGESQMGAAMSNHGVVAVRVPVAERFAIHKLLVSQLRTGRPEKSLKDRKQAAVLIAALGELHSGAIEAAFKATPVSSRKRIRKALDQIGDLLAPHPQALEEITRAAR
jgi:hypothetical protein